MTDEAEELHSEELLTIPEAAARLGIHEKRLRRLLTRTEYKNRTQTQTRTTRTGQRQASMLPADLLRDIEARVHLEANGDNGDADADADIENGPSTLTQTRTGTKQVVLSAFYERLMTEKDARLAELAAALEHERETSRRLADALAREQALRALPAPQESAAYPPQAEAGTPAEVSEGTNLAVGSPETGAAAKQAAGAAQGAEGPAEAKNQAEAKSAVGSWWARLWGRVKD